ncbi:MAG: hypothetical protein D6753_02090 [Planctomycetota bacterium]|nr:MAG: hypothetical protein D6753_02090 [Planctomycetota bacterium]
MTTVICPAHSLRRARRSPFDLRSINHRAVDARPQGTRRRGSGRPATWRVAAMVLGWVLASVFAPGVMGQGPQRASAAGNAVGQPAGTSGQQGPTQVQESATSAAAADAHPSPGSDDRPSPSTTTYHTERVEGRVVWAADALHEHFGISTVPEARERVLAIWTDDGDLIPLVENLRGRAFRSDERLRQMDLQLVIRRYEKHPFAQVLRLYQRVDGDLYEVDYWCDVCAIVMFESGPCACCQDPNRLRRRWVDPQTGTTTRRELPEATPPDAADFP